MLSLLLLSLICDSFLLSMFFFCTAYCYMALKTKSRTVSVYKGPFIRIKLRADVLLLSNLW